MDEPIEKVQIIKSTHDCGCAVDNSMSYCPRCGKKVFESVRSANEIKAMVQMIKSRMESSSTDAALGMGDFIQITAMAIPVVLALEWSLGNSTTPMEMLDSLIKRKEMRS